VDAWKDISHPKLMAASRFMPRSIISTIMSCRPKGLSTKPCWEFLSSGSRQRVEIRVVLACLDRAGNRGDVPVIARNLRSSISRVDGLENTGFAIANDAMLWMDPMTTARGWPKAVDHLAAAGVNVSIYNLPENVFFRNSVWPHALQSISDWKNAFVEECADATKEDLQRLLHDRTSAFQSRHSCNHLLAKPQISTAVLVVPIKRTKINNQRVLLTAAVQIP